MIAHEDYVRFCSFLGTQEHLERIELDALKAASTRDQLGITSLGVILLIANYMEASGVPNDDFDPDWIGRLDDVEGIFSVLREIDARGGAA